MNASPLDNTAVPDDFWGQIRHQLTRIAAGAIDFADVAVILRDPVYSEVHGYHAQPAAKRVMLGSATDPVAVNAAFFAGSGGDDTVLEALEKAGWQVETMAAVYDWTARHRATGARIEYLEGDLYDRTPRLA